MKVYRRSSHCARTSILHPYRLVQGEYEKPPHNTKRKHNLLHKWIRVSVAHENGRILVSALFGNMVFDLVMEEQVA